MAALLLVALILTFSFTIGGWAGRQLSPPAAKGLQKGVASKKQVGTVKSGTTHGTSTPQKAPVASIIIPAIGVDAPLEAVGVLPTGVMAVPVQNPWTGVGWYHNGPFPGEKGSAVVDGHLDRPGGAPAVFWRIHSLHVGDVIIVSHPGRKTLTFRVTEMQFYTPQQAPLARIFRNTSGTFLNLVTCAGTWLPLEHQTTLRLVVYSTLVA